MLTAICLLAGGLPSAESLAEEREKRELRIGPELYSYTYTEPGIMEDKGYLYGLAASYSWYGDAFFRLDGRLATGKVDYTSRRTGSADNIDYSVFEIRGLFGRSFNFSAEKEITLYAGLGYRYLYDDFGGRVISAKYWSYDRESNYYYLPVGLELLSGSTGAWSHALILEYDYFLMGKQVSYLGNESPDYLNVTNDQDSGYGWRVAIRFQRELKEGMLVLEPFARYWHIDRSDLSIATRPGVSPIEIGYEPANETKELGVRFTWKFHR